MSQTALLNGKPATPRLEPAAPEAAQIPATAREVVIGRLADLAEDGTALVEYEVGEEAHRCRALVAVPLVADDVGRSAALAFVRGDVEQPIVLGLVMAPAAPSRPSITSPSDARPRTTEDRIVLTAENEIVLRCGKASVTLTRAGKILLRGAYLLSRSSGVNRIKGGSVQIN